MARDQLSSAVKKVLIGLLIAEYGMRQLPNRMFSNNTLNHKATKAIAAVRDMQFFFLNNPGHDNTIREAYHREFFGNENLLVAEIMETIHGLNEDDLAIILEGLQSNIEQ
jgi:hypothetical protein